MLITKGKEKKEQEEGETDEKSCMYILKKHTMAANAKLQNIQRTME